MKHRYDSIKECARHPLGEKTMKQYFRVFCEKGDEFDRYWASISTKIPAKDENAKAEYVSANISARLSKKAEEVFRENAVKTKTKGIKQCSIKSENFWLKAVKPKDKDVKPFVILFIDDAEAVEEDDE